MFPLSLTRLKSLAATLMLMLACGCGQNVEPLFGAYRLDDGRLISVRESLPGTLRLRIFESGVSSRFEEDNGIWRSADAAAADTLSNASLAFNATGFTLTSSGATLDAVRLALPERTASVSTDVTLHVRLTLPMGPPPHPAVVLLQGSGDDAATRTYATGDFFAANGIAAVVYDKRGTGSSGGNYTHNFQRLADDAVAVVNWLATQPDIDPQRIGVTGYSQGGWVGPLAASKSEQISFVIANYGMINSPRDEERTETVAAVARRGYDGPALAQVARLSEASIDVMARGFDGWEAYDRISREYRNEPWMEDLDGTTIGAFEMYPHWIVGLVGPFMAPEGLDWEYTSHQALDILHQRNVPVVWQIAADDRSAPNGPTLAEVQRRMAAGENHQLQVFANSDHGFVLFTEDADGKRSYGNYHPDYFEAEINWARWLTGLEVPAEP